MSSAKLELRLGPAGRVVSIVATIGLSLGSTVNSAVAANAEFRWNLPAGFHAPVAPPDNPMSVEKVGLGRRLFLILFSPRPGPCHARVAMIRGSRSRMATQSRSAQPESAGGEMQCPWPTLRTRSNLPGQIHHW